MIQLIDICCFNLFNNHIFPTGFHETMVGGSQTCRGVLVHTSEGVIDNNHLLNVAKYPKSWLLMNHRYHKIATTLYCWLTNFGTKFQNYYTETINRTVIFWLANILSCWLTVVVMDTPTREGSWKTCRQEHNLYDVPEEENEPGQATRGVLQEAGSDHWDLDLHLGHSQGQKPQTNPGKCRSILTYVKCQRSLSQHDHQDTILTQLVHIHHWNFSSCLSAMRPLQLFAVTQTNRARKALQMEKNIHGPESTFQTFSNMCLSFFFCVVETE